jgi:hypothetical protein
VSKRPMHSVCGRQPATPRQCSVRQHPPHSRNSLLGADSSTVQATEPEPRLPSQTITHQPSKSTASVQQVNSCGPPTQHSQPSKEVCLWCCAQASHCHCPCSQRRQNSHTFAASISRGTLDDFSTQQLLGPCHSDCLPTAQEPAPDHARHDAIQLLHPAVQTPPETHAPAHPHRQTNNSMHSICCCGSRKCRDHLKSKGPMNG